MLNFACLMLLNGVGDPTCGATQVKEGAARLQTQPTE